MLYIILAIVLYGAGITLFVFTALELIRKSPKTKEGDSVLLEALYEVELKNKWLIPEDKSFEQWKRKRLL